MRATFIAVFIVLTVSFFLRHEPDEAAVRSAVIGGALLIVYGLLRLVGTLIQKIRS